MEVFTGSRWSAVSVSLMSLQDDGVFWTGACEHTIYGASGLCRPGNLRLMRLGLLILQLTIIIIHYISIIQDLYSANGLCSFLQRVQGLHGPACESSQSNGYIGCGE